MRGLSLNAASAAATTGVWSGVNSPRSYSSRTMGVASTAAATLAGTSRNAIWRMPMDTVERKPSMSPRAASREMAGKSTVATATENIPWGSM